MSVARKCDRCGKFYERNTGKWEDYGARGVAYSFTINGPCTDIITYDLCDSCMDGLKEFMGLKRNVVEEDKNGKEGTE